MLIHVLTAYPPPTIDPSLWVRESAALDPFQKHQLTNDPDAADMIPFAESHFNWDPYMLKVFTRFICDIGRNALSTTTAILRCRS